MLKYPIRVLKEYQKDIKEISEGSLSITLEGSGLGVLDKFLIR